MKSVVVVVWEIGLIVRTIERITHEITTTLIVLVLIDTMRTGSYRRLIL
jgi:hypothetical protein